MRLKIKDNTKNNQQQASKCPWQKRECRLVNSAKARYALEHALCVVQHSLELGKAFPVLEDQIKEALTGSPRNCDRFDDEKDAMVAYLREVWLIDVDEATMLERDKFENWPLEAKERYAKWLMEIGQANSSATILKIN